MTDNETSRFKEGLIADNEDPAKPRVAVD